MSEVVGGPGSEPPRSRPEDGTGGPYDAPPTADPAPQAAPSADPYGAPRADYAAPGETSGPVGFGAPAPVAGGEPPSPVRTATVLMYIAAAFALLGGVLGIVAASLNSLNAVIGVLLIAFGIAYIVLAGRIRKGNRTARTVAVVLVGLSLLGDVLQLGRSTVAAIIGIVLNGVIIYLLMFHQDSKRFFGDRA